MWTKVMAVVIVCAGAAMGQGSGAVDFTSEAGSQDLSISAIASHDVVRPGQRFHVAVDIRIGDQWVYYSPDPGQIAQPARVAVRPIPWQAGDALWPADHAKTVDIAGQKITNNVYERRAVVYIPLAVPADAPAGPVRLTVSAGGQICHKEQGTCISVDRSVQTAVEVAGASKANPAWASSDPQIATGLGEAKTAEQLAALHAQPAPSARAKRLTVGTGLALALLAGLILNVMPCVLPVIPLRIVSLVQAAGASRRRYAALGIAFAGGIILFFAAVAAANVILRLATGRVFNLSEHFQSPTVRIALALLIVAMAANLFGLFTVTVPRRLAAVEARSDAARRKGYLSSVGMGLMMAILATPCSFAILALALAWAQLQPLWLGTTAILLIGVGMASPHAILSALPRLLAVLPKPGLWMEKLKQMMGFLLLPVAIWLIGTLTTDSYALWVVAYAVVVVFGLWVWGSWVRYDASLKRKLLVRGLAAAIVVSAGIWMLRPPRPLAVDFASFDAQRIASASDAGKIVLVKFTAAWCLSCKWVDAAIYNDPSIAEELAARGVVVMGADVTNRGSVASEFLAANFGGGPPLTVIYPPGNRPPILLEGKFSELDLLEALDSP